MTDLFGEHYLYILQNFYPHLLHDGIFNRSKEWRIKNNDCMNKKIDIPFIICAAIWYKAAEQRHPTCPNNITEGVVVAGRRHGDCISTFISLTGKRNVEPGPYIMGFLTSDNRFVDREKAAIIAFNAGQTEKKLKTLFSEDIY